MVEEVLAGVVAIAAAKEASLVPGRSGAWVERRVVCVAAREGVIEGQEEPLVGMVAKPVMAPKVRGDWEAKASWGARAVMGATVEGIQAVGASREALVGARVASGATVGCSVGRVAARSAVEAAIRGAMA